MITVPVPYLKPQRIAIALFLCLISILSRAQNIQLMLPSAEQVTSLSAGLSGNTRRLALADPSNQISVWDAEKVLRLKNIRMKVDEIGLLVLDHEGTNLAVTYTADGQDSLSVINLISNRTQKFPSNGGIYEMHFNASENLLFTLGSGGISIYDLKAGKPVDSEFKADFSMMSMAHNGKFFAHLTPDSLSIVSIPGLGKKISIADNFSLIAPSFNRNDEYIASAYGRNISVWSTTLGNMVRQWEAHDSDITHLYYHPSKNMLFSSGADSIIKVWNAADGTLVKELQGHLGEISSISFSADGSRMVSTSNDKQARLDNSVIVWDTEALTQTLLIPFGRRPTFTTRFSGDGNRLLVDFYHTEPPQLFDVKTGRAIRFFETTASGVSHATFRSDYNEIITLNEPFGMVFDQRTGLAHHISSDAYYEEVFTGFYSPGRKYVAIPTFSLKQQGFIVGDFKEKKVVHHLDTGTTTTYVQFNREGTMLVSASLDGGLFEGYNKWYPKIFGVDGRLISTLSGHRSGVYRAVFSPDGTKIATASQDSTARIWSVPDGQEKLLLQHGAAVKLANFSDDGTHLLTATDDNTINLWSIKTAKIVRSFKLDVKAKEAEISPDLKKIICITDDNITQLINVETGKMEVRMVTLDSANYLLQNAEGFYMATRDAAKRLYYVTDDMKVITFDQLDIKFNRPDKVLESMGSADTLMIRIYHDAYQKRLKKLGVDTALFRKSYVVPEADFKNRHSIPYQSVGDKIQLQIAAADKTTNIERFNVWINGVPLYGTSGVNLQHRRSAILDTIITATLSAGDNIIETSVTNANGIESYRMPLNVRFDPPAGVKPKLYFAGIGVDKYKRSKYNLSWSVKDIRDLANTLKTLYGNDVEIDTLFNESVTLENVSKLKAKLENSKVDDRVVVAFSGHGLLNRKMDYYLATYDVDFASPEKGGIPYEVMEGLVDDIPSRQKLLLLDACHSGELDREGLDNIKSAEAKLKAKGVTNQSKGITKEGGSDVGMTGSFELMQLLFANVGKSTGATIISAAAGTQFAYEKNQLKNGVFSYSILEFLRNNKEVSVNTLKKYVNTRVSELTEGLQVPTTRSENNAVDWNLW